MPIFSSTIYGKYRTWYHQLWLRPYMFIVLIVAAIWEVGGSIYYGTKDIFNQIIYDLSKLKELVQAIFLPWEDEIMEEDNID